MKINLVRVRLLKVLQANVDRFHHYSTEQQTYLLSILRDIEYRALGTPLEKSLFKHLGPHPQLLRDEVRRREMILPKSLGSAKLFADVLKKYELKNGQLRRKK